MEFSIDFVAVSEGDVIQRPDSTEYLPPLGLKDKTLVPIRVQQAAMVGP